MAARGSLGTGYVAGGLLASLAVPIVLSMRWLAGDADRIVGQAGRYRDCPSLALPEGVAVAAERDVEAEVGATIG